MKWWYERQKIWLQSPSKHCHFFHEVYFISIMYIHVFSFPMCVKSQIHLSLSHSQENGTGWYTICWLFPFLELNSSFPTSSHFLFPFHFHEACYFQDDMQHDNDEGERHRILKQRKGTKFCYTTETSKRILPIILKRGLMHSFNQQFYWALSELSLSSTILSQHREVAISKNSTWTWMCVYNCTYDVFKY